MNEGEVETPTPLRLYREPDDKKLAGVCSGLADYFGLDPTVVRLAVVALTVTTGVAVLGYIIAALVIPLRPATVPRAQATPAMSGAGRSTGLLIAVLLLVFLAAFGEPWWLNAPTAGLGLVALGVWLLVKQDEQRSPRSATTDREMSAFSTTRSVEGTTVIDEAASERDQSDSDVGRSTTVRSSESADRAGPRGEVPPPVPPRGPSPSTLLPPPFPTSHGRFPTAIAALVMIGVGLVALLVVFDVWDLDVEETVGAGLVVLGAVLLVGAWRGRPQPLIALGIPALGFLVLADTIDLPINAGAGDRLVEVDTMAELRALDDTYELLAGDLVLDLRDAPLGRPGAPTPSLSADVGFGNLTVRLPDDVTAELDMDVGAGGIQVDRRSAEDGIDVDRSLVLEGETGGGRIRLDLHVGLGEIEVRRG